jgi:hypothetical protein
VIISGVRAGRKACIDGLTLGRDQKNAVLFSGPDELCFLGKLVISVKRGKRWSCGDFW